jgi:hypothetical protein
MNKRPYHLALFFISAALLSFEISLMRMLRVEGFGNFTYGAIALALTGFGASGTILSLFRKKIRGWEYHLSFWSPVLFCLFLGFGFWCSMLVDFDALRILWDRNQVFRLLFRYLLYTIPFITGSAFVVLSFSIGSPGRVYAFNLTGSGFGVMLILVSLHFIPPSRILAVPMFLALLSVLFSGFAFSGLALKRYLCLPLIAAGIILLSMGDIHILPFKGREMALNLPNAQIVEQHLSAHGTIEIISSDKIRIAPGLSLTFEAELPEQHALYIDGDFLSSIDRITGISSMDYLLFTTQQAVYQLHEKPAVFIAGLGGGTPVERGFRSGAREITAAEENPYLPVLLRGPFSNFTGGLFNKPEITLTSKAVRSFLYGSGKRWDIIDIPENTLASSIGGIYAADSDYRLTVQAFGEYLEALGEGGTLSATVALKQPPRNLPKLTATIMAALKKRNKMAAQCIVIIRSWASGTVLVKKRPFTPGEISRIRGFCEAMRFDLVYYPGMKPGEANRFNIVQDRIYHRTVVPIIRGEGTFSRQYVFNIEPATDDRPYFSYFFRIDKLHHLFRETGKQWLFVVEGGYIVLFTTFVTTLLLAALFILIPPVCLHWKVTGVRTEVLMYFSMIALAFMFIEILLIQKFRRYIANPLYSSSLIIATLLICTGIASFFSDRITRRKRSLTLALAALTVYFAILLLMFESLFPYLMRGPRILEVILPMLSTAPLGLLMGFFFPLGMSGLKETDAGALPWAWSINGFFSVIASSGAVLLASNAGLLFTAVIAMICYWVALFFFPGMHGRV